MGLFRKKEPAVKKNTAKPVVKPNKLRKNEDYVPEAGYAEEYATLYAELEAYDPSSIYYYVDAYEHLELDPAEVNEKIDSTVQEAATDEEAAQDLNDTLEQVYAGIQYLGYVAEQCAAKVTELGFEPVLGAGATNDTEMLDLNMDTSDLLEPVEEDDEDELVRKLETAKRRRANRKTPNRRPVTNEEYIKGIPDPALRASILNYREKEKAYKKSLVATIATNTRVKWTEKQLAPMDIEQLENIVASMGAEMPPDYGIRGMQAALKANADEGVPLSIDIFAPRKKKEEGK